jgi:hypothetical protein
LPARRGEGVDHIAQLPRERLAVGAGEVGDRQIELAVTIHLIADGQARLAAASVIDEALARRPVRGGARVVVVVVAAGRGALAPSKIAGIGGGLWHRGPLLAQQPFFGEQGREK